MNRPANPGKELVGYSQERQGYKIEAVFADTSGVGYCAANWQL